MFAFDADNFVPFLFAIYRDPKLAIFFISSTNLGTNFKDLS